MPVWPRNLFVSKNFITVSKNREEVKKMGKTVSFLYKLARMANDVEKVSSGDPKRMARRAKNKYVGRKLVRKTWKFPF